MKQKKWAITFAAIVLIVIIGAGTYLSTLSTTTQTTSQQTEAMNDFQKTLTIVTPMDPRILGWPQNPVVQNHLVVKETFDTLVRYENGSFNIKPDLATSWEISPDGLVYTFHLRQGVTFYPSGDPFNAQAVKYSFDTAFGNNTMAALYVMGPVRVLHTDVVDDYTVKIYIDKPLAWFLDDLTYGAVGAIINPKWVAAHGGTPNSTQTMDPYFLSHQDTVGPYVVDQFSPGDRVVLKRNPTYWMGWNGVLANRPERIVIRVIPEAATRMMLLARGDADLGYVDVQYLPELQSRIQSENLPLTLDTGSTGILNFILLDHKNLPTSDVHIRKMLAWSFNYDGFLNDVIHGLGYRLYSYVPQGMTGYQPNVPHYDFDLAKAKAELALASPEAQKMVAEGIKVTYFPGYAIGKDGYLMWKADLAKIGVNLILNEVSLATYKDMQYNGGAIILDRKWTPDYPDPQTYYGILSWNLKTVVTYGLTPSNMNDIINGAAFIRDMNERLKVYSQVEQWAYDDVPYIKVASSRANALYNVRGNWLNGYTSFIMDEHRPLLYELWKNSSPTGNTSTPQILRGVMPLLLRWKWSSFFF